LRISQGLSGTVAPAVRIPSPVENPDQKGFFGEFFFRRKRLVDVNRTDDLARRLASASDASARSSAASACGRADAQRRILKGNSLDSLASETRSTVWWLLDRPRVS